MTEQPIQKRFRTIAADPAKNPLCPRTEAERDEAQKAAEYWRDLAHSWEAKWQGQWERAEDAAIEVKRLEENVRIALSRANAEESARARQHQRADEMEARIQRALAVKERIGPPGSAVTAIQAIRAALRGEEAP